MMEMTAKSKKVLHAQVEALSRKVEHFNKTELESLILMFNSLMAEQFSRGRPANGLKRGKFRGLLQGTFEMTNAVMMDGVFRSFDKDGHGVIILEEWIRGLAVFLRGTLDEKIRHTFRVYDLNNDKFISKDEIFHMLKHSFIKWPSEEDPDEGIKDVVEITMKKMDLDHDGMLSFDDFQKSVLDENLFLQAFGPCLPDNTIIAKFEQLAFKEPEQ
ncbi:calaxin [Poecilia latipinna]|uniref:EF-hand calcium binding domain 1 n=2 Tax=Poecilia TaxID=8080 RepID=A0A3B3VZE3_9TELE|nr:PREDICTED: EF-hand calcium-binding domain-containing protein 1 [Poecilia formosa]XP_014865715.1 PREDICTED: EF-hand calcium-binding domain-containing protein 1 [Poecilia mexicana]XP_014909649.1 PREDICTED: EF-hand calcium-binding domain-containing protein 1 [Poecilia latipinna]